MTHFLAAMVAYTGFETAYWYYRWWHNFRDKPFPTVKSLLWAILFSNLCIATGILMSIVTDAPMLQWRLGLVGLGLVFHLIPVWKQQVSNPLSFLFRASLAGFLTTWILYYV